MTTPKSPGQIAYAIPIRVTRYQCPHCRRTRSSKRAAEAHVARCWRNPAARSCHTCDIYQPREKPDRDPRGYPGCPEGCEAEGGPDLADGLPVNCPLWERNRWLKPLSPSIPGEGR